MMLKETDTCSHPTIILPCRQTFYLYLTEYDRAGVVFVCFKGGKKSQNQKKASSLMFRLQFSNKRVIIYNMLNSFSSKEWEFKKIIKQAYSKMPLVVVGFMGIMKGNINCRFEFCQTENRGGNETCMSQIWGNCSECCTVYLL